jgi:hypothetical protein
MHDGVGRQLADDQLDDVDMTFEALGAQPFRHELSRLGDMVRLRRPGPAGGPGDPVNQERRSLRTRCDGRRTAGPGGATVSLAIVPLIVASDKDRHSDRTGRCPHYASAAQASVKTVSAKFGVCISMVTVPSGRSTST